MSVISIETITRAVCEECCPRREIAVAVTTQTTAGHSL